jgi:glycine dehydrogenase
VLLAVVASMYAVYHGPDGIKRIAERVHAATALLAEALRQLGYTLAHETFFDTLAIETDAATAGRLHEAARAKGINLRPLSTTHVAVALDETVLPADLRDLIEVFALGRPAPSLDELAENSERALPAPFRRTSEYLTHPVFRQHHSETEMLRYIKALEAKDLSLTAAMIPLGSCTMKLNATSEMIPISWPEFNKLHPFAPLDQTQGYQELFRELEAQLSEITGFAGVSLQPNAGSQGEYAGLLVIHAYHANRGEAHRNVCLIPQSAHGTNPASAVMAGMHVVPVKTDPNGNVDIADLRTKAEQYRDTLSCLMITYPSTHGVFEAGIKEICEIVHAHGGQVYMDGANMNAQVGLCRPGDIGADVCHLNLHKTFCIPHGGGGPGMGPIGVAAHLVPFLPNHPVVNLGHAQTAGVVSAAPWGSPSILPISWAYITMMGGPGLTEATKVAILNANYIAKRLEGHYKLLYAGPNGLIAHECILDTRPFKASAAVDVADIAKRIIDFGFHPPTVSFPVAGTLMVEPTESEPKEELDRFIEAMIAIRDEIREVESGAMPKGNNLLTNAPHTMRELMADAWDRPYSRERAGFPTEATRAHKVWPTVKRIEDAFGDRNLICTCTPMEAFEVVGAGAA